MDIKLDTDKIKEIVSAAIMQQVGDRDVIVQAAIKHLLTPQEIRGGYGKTGDTPLQEAFKFALENTARQVVREMVLGDEAVKATIRAAVSKMIVKASSSEVLAEKAVEFLSRALDSAVNNVGR